MKYLNKFKDWYNNSPYKIAFYLSGYLLLMAILYGVFIEWTASICCIYGCIMELLLTVKNKPYEKMAIFTIGVLFVSTFFFGFFL